MDLHRVLEGKPPAPFPVLRCLLQESLPHSWDHSQSWHSGGARCGDSPHHYCPASLVRAARAFPMPRPGPQRNTAFLLRTVKGHKTNAARQTFIVYWFHLVPTAPGFWQPHTSFAEKDQLSQSSQLQEECRGNLILFAFPCGKQIGVAYIITAK